MQHTIVSSTCCTGEVTFLGFENKPDQVPMYSLGLATDSGLQKSAKILEKTKT